MGKNRGRLALTSSVKKVLDNKEKLKAEEAKKKGGKALAIKEAEDEDEEDAGESILIQEDNDIIF